MNFHFEPLFYFLVFSNTGLRLHIARVANSTAIAHKSAPLLPPSGRNIETRSHVGLPTCFFSEKPLRSVACLGNQAEERRRTAPHNTARRHATQHSTALATAPIARKRTAPCGNARHTTLRSGAGTNRHGIPKEVVCSRSLWRRLRHRACGALPRSNPRVKC
jgi:hypothetical protein